ncbi:DNA polymerase I [Natranaerovirga pectinivora]|uniref:DNA polymerase I n=1 Tax=Natranaerovirga pectinivora TaxID=682400 RepID=A0A4R3MPF0_9FIRM|nr:DNA polymerase I [Natranaerovirga pectinivora]TCT17101.1 DNA polymerase I [Natranaerovirga pectinivora]
MSKILLVDGHSILNRAFYGLPLLTNNEGLHTNAVYGFLNILFKILDEEKSEYAIVAFDVSQPTFRHEMFEEYKGTRKGMPDELREQVPIIKEVLKTMGVNILECPGFEADDIIGTIAAKGEEKGLEVSILSGDRDLLQLATDVVKIRIPKTKKGGTEIENYNSEEVLAKYEVNPKEYIDVKGLMGDPSDNIPGVPGIGEKTAVKIIKEYKSIENAYENIDKVKPARAANNLKEFYDQALLSKKLATIKVDCDVDLDLECSKLSNLFNEETYKLFKRLEFKTLLTRFNFEVDYNNLKDLNKDNFNCIKNSDDFKNIKKAICEQEVISITLIGQDSLLGISLCYGEESAYYIPISLDISEDDIICYINELFLQDNKKIVVHNLKKQLQLVKNKGIQFNIHSFFDTHLAAYLCNPSKETYNYDELANEFLSLLVPSEEELLGKGRTKKLLNTILEDDLVNFACYQTSIFYKAYEVLNSKLETEKMKELFYNIEMPLVEVLYEMEQLGIKIDSNALKEYGNRLLERITELEEEIFNLAGETFNINSPKQLGEILFEKLELPTAKKTKTGYSTAQDVLEKLVDKHPIINLITEYRHLVKLKSTYADGLFDCICQEDNRIHSQFNQTITATGRISSTEPNLQNIPIKLELGREIRKVFVPEEGYSFVDADYSQIELRLLAHLSQDDKLIDAYKNNQDIHRLTASQVFHTPFEEVTSLQRSNAKAVNFGIVYGISAFGLSQDLNITRKEADTYINNYFDKYPSVKIFLENTIRLAKERGFAVTMFNRRRLIPELQSKNFMQRSFGERVAMNSPIQGSAADIIKIAMIKVHNKLKELNLKSRLILQVHDELLIEAHNSEIEQVKTILISEMERAVELSVPLDIDVNVGKSWYETK